MLEAGSICSIMLYDVADFGLGSGVSSIWPCLANPALVNFLGRSSDLADLFTAKYLKLVLFCHLSVLRV